MTLTAIAGKNRVPSGVNKERKRVSSVSLIAFVDVFAVVPRPHKTGITCANEPTRRVSATGIGVAGVDAQSTFVDVAAKHAIPFKTGMTFTPGHFAVRITACILITLRTNVFNAGHAIA